MIGVIEAEDEDTCDVCGHPWKQHRVGLGWGPDPFYQCWERDHPYCGGRCGCKRNRPTPVAPSKPPP